MRKVEIIMGKSGGWVVDLAVCVKVVKRFVDKVGLLLLMCLG